MERTAKFRRSLFKRMREIRGQRYYVKRTGGLTYLLDRENRVDRFMDAAGNYEAEQQTYLFVMMAENNIDAFLDVGAHWGLYSLRVQQQFGSAMEIHAFEPDALNRNQLHANLFLNDLDSIRVHDYGISDQSATLGFHREDKSNRGMSKITASGERQIAVRRLDDVLAWQGRRVCLKIDVEGHEAQAIVGMQRFLQENFCLLQMESGQTDPESVLGESIGANYRYIKSIGHDHYFISKTGS